MMEKRARKLALAAREIPVEEKLTVYGAPHAAFTVVSWGSNKGAILEALQRLAADGIARRAWCRSASSGRFLPMRSYRC